MKATGIVRCTDRADASTMSRTRCNLSAGRLRAHLLAGRTHAGIAAIEGLTVDQVDHRIRRLGLARKRPLPGAVEILAMIDGAVTRVEIARMFGCSPAAVTLRLKRAQVTA